MPIDPIPWIKNANITLQPEPEPWVGSMTGGKEIDEDRIQRAIADWRQPPKGKGNESFFPTRS
jgi:hypothetical protein